MCFSAEIIDQDQRSDEASRIHLIKSSSMAVPAAIIPSSVVKTNYTIPAVIIPSSVIKAKFYNTVKYEL